MSGRLPSGLIVAALLRRVNDAGGIGAVRARGDTDAGAILLILADRDLLPRVMERGIGPDGGPILLSAGPADADADSIEAYWRKRRARDPDLWVIELDIADAERFAAETILAD